MSKRAPNNSATNVPVIEFLKGRIYLGAYDFNPVSTDELVYFTVEDALPYNSFHLDFGPLHIGHLYRFAVVLHNVLNDENNQGKAIVFYSSTSAKARANAACLLCCYMVLVQSWSPHQVLQPISQIDPPVMPFRDAGYANADFEITIQDIVYGIWRARERGMIELTSFNLEEFEQYERVDQGDLNIVSKDFIAFASPQQARPGAPLNEPFKKVLGFFKKHDVKLVVRLNSHLYDSQEFTKRGIKHIDMIFDDGTCPTMEFVQNFIGVAEGVIKEGGKIAVHCKAGLGRTGCLIGAHLIYTHGFTANECIGYMRMIRPGMVVGPQQHWLYLHQHEFRSWRYTMVLDTVANSKLSGYSSLIPYEVYKARHKSINSSIVSSHSSRRRVSGRMKKSLHTAVPVQAPGQPRKGDNGRYVSNSFITNNSDDDDYENIDEMEESKPTLDEISIDKENKVAEDSIESGKSSSSSEEHHASASKISESRSTHGSPKNLRRRHGADKNLEDSITSSPTKEVFTIRADEDQVIEENDNGISTPPRHKIDEKAKTSNSVSRRTRNNTGSATSSPQSSWRVLRSITSPNSKNQNISSSKTSTPISASYSKKDTIDVAKVKSRSSARKVKVTSPGTVGSVQKSGRRKS